MLDASVDSVLAASEARKVRLRVGICYALCSLIWGTTWFAVRISVEPGDGYPPTFAAALRFFIALLIYAFLALVFHRKISPPTKSELIWVSIAGLFHGFYQTSIYYAECVISGGLAAVLMSTSPLMVACMVAATGLEKIRKQTIIGFLVSLAGVALVCHDRMNVAGAQVAGVGLTLLAAFFVSLSNVCLKGRASQLHPLLSGALLLLATDIPIWIAFLLSGEKVNFFPIAFAPFSAVLYMAIMSSVLAFLFFLYMIKRISLMAISTLSFVIPVLALVVDMFLEKQITLSAQVWVGIAVVLAGLLLSMRRG